MNPHHNTPKSFTNHHEKHEGETHQEQQPLLHQAAFQERPELAVDPEMLPVCTIPWPKKSGPQRELNSEAPAPTYSSALRGKNLW